ncbi:MAP7 domain-containing protein 1-like [Carassius auratus]|uniref:MAP7 domain-containing protein 1-like n=1 Tax=Carassius auratus TaxID=7957 RepID=A0A6P6J9P2_CARAU|nr:MAP7 domain-containing protein 1-like [Carassius auratus]
MPSQKRRQRQREKERREAAKGSSTLQTWIQSSSKPADEAEAGSESEGEPIHHQPNQTLTDENASESIQRSKSEGLGTEPETEKVQNEKERQYNETEREETDAEQEEMESEAATAMYTREKKPEDFEFLLQLQNPSDPAHVKKYNVTYSVAVNGTSKYKKYQ